MAKKKMIHLVCNAHIDPVWLWQWQEGAAETISTFRTAAEFCEKNGSFVFNHNEAVLYKLVQEYEPELFNRIKRLVRRGQWHIMGGWYLQPDCNMPAGESFVRQILIGKQYFKEQFGVESRTAINFDPFGHTRGLVQILAKSGYDSYLFGRPIQKDCQLAGDEFVWVGYDGSEVMGKRFVSWYNSPLGKAAEKIEKWMTDNPNEDFGIILWGVGNHGGGPSRLDLRKVNKIIAGSKSHDIRHSTPEAYFRQLRRIREKLPRHEGDLNPWAVGCYSSQIRIKQKHRQLENQLYSLEKTASTAAVNGLMKYPAEQVNEAFYDLLNSEFHDALPGSSIQPVEEQTLEMLGHGLEIAARLKNKAFFALGSGQPKAKPGNIPILIYNPHPHKVKGIVECEFSLADMSPLENYHHIHVHYKGRKLVSQVEQELCNLSTEWRKKVVFLAELEPGQMNRFDCEPEIAPQRPQPKLKGGKEKMVFKGRDIEVVINKKTGLIDKYRAGTTELTDAGAFEPIVIKDDADSWGMLVKSFGRVIGRFRLMSKKAGSGFSGLESNIIDSVRIIEDGPVRTVIEAVFSYGDSFICQRYKLPKIGTEIEVETRVYWNEKDKMLKLSVPVAAGQCQYLGQVAYGVEELPTDGTEAVSQKWAAIVDRKRNAALSCINDGIYSSDFSNGLLRLTLLRSAAYSCHPAEDGLKTPVKNRFAPRMDQGERLFRFWFNLGKVSERLTKIDREALAKNEKPDALSFFPPGGGKKPKPLAVLDDNVVQITAMKKAETNNDLIIRLFEPTGRKRSCTLSLPTIGKKIRVNLGKFEVQTLRINTRTGKYIQTDLLERP